MNNDRVEYTAKGLDIKMDTIELLQTDDDDIKRFREGNHGRLHQKMGAHRCIYNGETGTYFSVWAPNARMVSVIGNFNNWSDEANPLHLEDYGIWQGFIPGVAVGELYKYHIVSQINGYKVNKSDPFSLYCETPPGTATHIWDISYNWNDQDWMGSRKYANSLYSPISIYELHIGSWLRAPGNGSQYLSYRELAEKLAAYVIDMGFTHVEFLPVMEHPFYGSWGYQITGFFAPSSRYGTPQEFMFLIDYLHRHNIGVILDWVPSHFPDDEHGLAFFDGSHLYEHTDPKRGIHPDWNSLIFNYDKPEVRSFLLSNALFWLENYHVDGLRVDSVASLLYLDYSRKDGEWIPNKYGGRENLAAINFLRNLNETVYLHYPDVQMIAEESSAWPMVSRPTSMGGLGFGMKWDMGWRHDTLEYMSVKPEERGHHHDKLTFRMMYVFSENFLLPFSHDEVVYGKSSLLNKMPGDETHKFANLRLLLGYLYTQPGKKLLFMGGEFGQKSEWNHDTGIDWNLLRSGAHYGIKLLVSDLNRIYRSEPSLHRFDFDQRGFEWVECNDAGNSVLTFIRKGDADDCTSLVACNFNSLSFSTYRVGVPFGGQWNEIFNSNAARYGGSGNGDNRKKNAIPYQWHGRPFSLDLFLPSLSVVILKPATLD